MMQKNYFIIHDSEKIAYQIAMQRFIIFDSCKSDQAISEYEDP